MWRKLRTETALTNIIVLNSDALVMMFRASEDASRLVNR